MARAPMRSHTPFLALAITAGIAVLFAVLYLLMLGRLVNLGQSKAFYLIVLVPLACSAAVFLFLLIPKSIAEYVGQAWGGTIRLGGPPVVFFGIIVLGLALPGGLAFTQIVRLQLPRAQASAALGTVVLFLPSGALDARIDENNSATFTGIPREHIGKSVQIELRANGYRLANPDRAYALADSEPIAVAIERDTVGLVVRGFVLSGTDQRPIDGATVTVGDRTVTTDANGRFEATLPAATEARSVSVRIVCNGYEAKQLDVAALRADHALDPISILLTPK